MVVLVDGLEPVSIGRPPLVSSEFTVVIKVRPGIIMTAVFKTIIIIGINVKVIII